MRLPPARIACILELLIALSVKLIKISNVAFDYIAWTQAVLPVKQGGLGFRKATDIALPGLISSLLAVHSLVDAVLSRVSSLA